MKSRLEGQSAMTYRIAGDGGCTMKTAVRDISCAPALIAGRVWACVAIDFERRLIVKLSLARCDVHARALWRLSM